MRDSDRGGTFLDASRQTAYIEGLYVSRGVLVLGPAG